MKRSDRKLTVEVMHRCTITGGAKNYLVKDVTSVIGFRTRGSERVRV